MAVDDVFAGVLPFVLAADSRSFRAAAKALAVTPSAISKAVSKLEEELGVRLLHRTSRAVRLTREGEGFLTRCRDAVDQVRAARATIETARNAPRGVLHLSLPLPLARTVASALPRLLARHPALTIRTDVTDRQVNLVEENVDVAVRIGLPRAQTLSLRKLGITQWRTVASPAYLARRSIPKNPSELANHNCLKFVTSAGREVEWQFTVNVDPAVTGNLSGNHGEALVTAAVSGLGVVQALDFMVERELARGELIEILPSFAAEGPPIVAVSTGSKQAAARVAVMLDFLVDLFRGDGSPRAKR